MTSEFEQTPLAPAPIPELLKGEQTCNGAQVDGYDFGLFVNVGVCSRTLQDLSMLPRSEA